MSARPDLTTEEMIRWCEEQATWAEGYDARERHAAIAQRLRSERPAVTPEMMMDAGHDAAAHVFARHGHQTVPRFVTEAVEAALDAALAMQAALSVSSTEGKQPGEGNG